MSAAADLAAALNAKRTPSGWRALCPAHDDHAPSLDIAEGDGGRALVVCRAGCTQADVVGALKARGLWPQCERTAPAARRIVKAYPYHDADGKLLFEVVRFDPKDFRQRRPDPTAPDGWSWKLGDCQRVLYRLPEVRAAVANGETVFVVEGERDADALAALGLCSTCNAGGAGKWKPEYTATLHGAHVVIIPDRDEPGRKHAALVQRELAGEAASVRVVELPDRDGQRVKDAADFVSAGGSLSELLAIVEAEPEESKPRLTSMSASALYDLDMPEPVWIVPGLLTQGATLLCSKPKVGKSWMALQLACAVADGGLFLSKYRCPKHDALYLALEDTPRRLKDRLARMLHGQRPPAGLHLVTDAPRMPSGLELLERELDAAPGVRLVIVDTLQRFRPPSGFRSGAYEGDYDALTPLKRMADTRGMALLIVHHVRKAGADDVFDTVSGTNGLTGAVDSTFILNRNRAEREGKLHGTGRDLEDVELPLRFASDGNWSAVEGANALPDAQAEVARVLQEAGRPLPIAEVAERVGKQYDATKKLLERMREAGRAAKERGGYVYTHSLPSLVSPVSLVSPMSPVSPVSRNGDKRDIGDIGIHPRTVEVEL
ncbi:MAG TPA: AAA family ATPase [Kiritimatiellia bacterium]|nr:AAA family ATPase [Kiritimatiellia bacterium]